MGSEIDMAFLRTLRRKQLEQTPEFVKEMKALKQKVLKSGLRRQPKLIQREIESGEHSCILSPALYDAQISIG